MELFLTSNKFAYYKITVMFFIFFFLLLASSGKVSGEISLLPCEDPRLRRHSSEVSVKELLSHDMQILLDEMIHFCTFGSTEISRPVGLAAPQIGRMQRIVVICNPSGKRPSCDLLINPKITHRSEKTSRYTESCYSVPFEIAGIVSRNNHIIVEALDRFGKHIRKEYSGYEARIAQHELDHLDGVRFPERVETPGELHIVHWGPETNAYLSSLKKNVPWHRPVDPKRWENYKKGFYSGNEEK